MPASTLATFRRSALASGLLTADDLGQVVAAVRGGRADREPTLDQLAEQLIGSGKLNRWQFEQLRLGHTKFNLGPYRMIDSIGQGGMGQIFKAEHTWMGRIVAVKVLPRHRSTPEAIDNFQREIRAQALLDHPNLVRALDAGHEGKVHFLVTEYVPGTDLRKYIRRHGKLSMEAAATVIVQAARGLEHAHSKGLIHRDIKPGNLLLTRDGQVKVSDLGLVSYFDERAADSLVRGKIVGTADYLAPEQIHSPDAITAAADIYALGCTLYYAVTGKVPFPGGTTRDKLRAHCEYQPLDPRRLNPELSGEFVDVLAELMAKRPEERVGTAAEAARRLAPWTDGQRLNINLEAESPAGQSDLAGHWTARRRATAPDLEDTQSPFVLDPESPPEESPSQVSQTTHPISAGSEETLPLLEAGEPLQRWTIRGLGAPGELGPGRALAIRAALVTAAVVATILAAAGGLALALWW